ncbi:MAG: Rrf2 family transcriptional regulator [Acidobacteriota bacterium]
MLKISKLTDYGLLAAVYLSRKRGEIVSGREVAEFYSLPAPMISKVLKVLHESGLIASHRGVGGGYSFDGDAEKVTLGKLLEVLEGPWDLVECESLDLTGHAVCAIRVECPSRGFMFGINRAIKNAFETITLGELARGAVPGAAVAARLTLRPEGSTEIQ